MGYFFRRPWKSVTRSFYVGIAGIMETKDKISALTGQKNEMFKPTRTARHTHQDGRGGPLSIHRYHALADSAGVSRSGDLWFRFRARQVGAIRTDNALPDLRELFEQQKQIPVP